MTTVKKWWTWNKNWAENDNNAENDEMTKMIKNRTWTQMKKSVNNEKEDTCQPDANCENDDNKHVEQWWTCMRLWKT